MKEYCTTRGTGKAVLVSVVIPTRDNAATIDQCLASVRAQDWPRLEILVVNDGSVDGTEQRIALHAADDARLRLLHTHGPRGAAAARNLGLRHAQGDVVAFIDGDIYAEPDWLRTLLAPISSGAADCTGGPDEVPATDPLVARCVGHSMDSPLATGGLRHGRTQLVRYLPGTGNMAVRRDLLGEAPFNEAFHDSGEDKELLYRLRARGCRMRYVAAARVWHHRTCSLRVHAQKMFRCGLRRVDIWRGIRGAVEAAHLVPALLALLGCVLAACALSGQSAALEIAAAAASALLLADAAWAAMRLRDLRAVGVVPLSSALVVAGYGAGICLQALRVAWALPRGRAENTAAG